MIRLPVHIMLQQEALDSLKEYQDEIDALPQFADKNAKAKKAFSQRNKKGNKTFDHIKEKLTEMCSGARRCAYCEDSVGDEVEHIFPKDLYPGHCFSWDNYLYACGNCNGPKNNKFAIFKKSDGKFTTVNPPHGQPSAQPPDGDAAMINPRLENAMDFCMLDLQSTFKFVVIAKKGTKEYEKADYTFNEVLRLNDQREFLRQARINAYGNFASRLYKYTDQKQKGATQQMLDKMIEGIQKEAHPTVWKEMQRYHNKGLLIKFDKELNDLFIASPEALQW